MLLGSRGSEGREAKEVEERGRKSLQMEAGITLQLDSFRKEQSEDAHVFSCRYTHVPTHVIRHMHAHTPMHAHTCPVWVFYEAFLDHLSPPPAPGLLTQLKADIFVCGR